MTTLSPAKAMLSASLALKHYLNVTQQPQPELPHLAFDERIAPLDDQLFWRSALNDHTNVEEVFAVVSG
jgi:hypothetical protein